MGEDREGGRRGDVLLLLWPAGCLFPLLATRSGVESSDLKGLEGLGEVLDYGPEVSVPVETMSSDTEVSKSRSRAPR